MISSGSELENLVYLFLSFCRFVVFCFFDKRLAGWPQSVWQTDVFVVCAVGLVSLCIGPHLRQSAVSEGYFPIALVQRFPAAAPVGP